MRKGIAVTHPERLHAPVGLDIGAVTPHEIAVSILAELIAVKYNRLGDGGARSLRWMPRALVEDPAPVGDETPAEEEPAILKSG